MAIKVILAKKSINLSKIQLQIYDPLSLYLPMNLPFELIIVWGLQIISRISNPLFIQEFMGSIINLIEIMAKEFEPVSRSEEFQEA